MITLEMMDAATQERMNDIARLRVEHDARVMPQGRPASPASRPTVARFHLQSFVAHILRPARAR